MDSQPLRPDAGCAPHIVVDDAQPDDMAAVQGIYAWHVLHGLATFEELPPSVEEMERRRQAVSDLVAMQQDAQRQTPATSEADFADALGQTRRMPAVKPAPKPPEAAGGHRRRRQAGFTVIIDDSTKQVQ